MKNIKSKKALIVATAVSLLTIGSSATASDQVLYEVWAADQSNSVAGAGSLGVDGSFIWVWNSVDVKAQIANGSVAQPLGCDGNNVPGEGPCDLKAVFPSTLSEHDGTQLTGETLGTSPNFGRLHGMIADPQNMYMNINSFVAGGGYIGIVDGATKEAIALFRVTQTNAASGDGRSLHMSFWNSDGSALLLANLHGRILERVDVTRDATGKITNANFNRTASLAVGSGTTILDDATAFTGNNSQGNALVSTVSGGYDSAALGDLTPAGNCKQNGCSTGSDASLGGRPANVIVCPIVSSNDNAYVTFGGGGLLVADTTATPMSIVGEYSQQVVNGAGCGGVQVKDKIWLNAGTSAAGSGATQSTFSVYAIDDKAFSSVQAPNTPAPIEIFKDANNTATLGNLTGDASNDTGQLPGTTTRRDAHGMARTLDGRFIHTGDRLQNVIEVFNTDTGNMKRVGSYDLTSADGQGQGLGPCAAASVSDDSGLPNNDPTPDLMDTTPDGKYLVFASRGPTPVSVTHNAQGSCPGVGIIALSNSGASGHLVTVLRTTNTIDDAPQIAPGGYDYTGTEHSDPHGASIRIKVESNHAHYDATSQLLYLPNTDAGELGKFNVTLMLSGVDPITLTLQEVVPSLLLGMSSSVFAPISGSLIISPVIVDGNNFDAELQLDNPNTFRFSVTSLTNSN